MILKPVRTSEEREHLWPRSTKTHLDFDAFILRFSELRSSVSVVLKYTMSSKLKG